MKPPLRILACCAVAGWALFPSWAQVPNPPSLTLDVCDARARDHPADLSSYVCYWRVARSLKAWDDAVRRLDARLALEPSNHLARLYLGLIEADRGRERARELIETAAAGLAAQKNYSGAVYGFISMAYYHQYRGDVAAAEEPLRRARQMAEASGDPLLLARMDWEDSRQALYGADYGKAWTLSSKAEAALTPDAPYDLRTGVLATLGAVCWATGRYRESMGYYQKESEIFRQAGDHYSEAGSFRDIALLASRLGPAEGVTLQDVRSLIRKAFNASVAAGNRPAEYAVRLLLAQDPTIDRPTRIGHLETVLSAGASAALVREALRLLAPLRFEEDPGHPEAALELINRAIALSRESGDPREIALACVARMHLRWMVGPRDKAIEDSLAALDAIERIRDLQRDGLVRARWFAEQSTYYYQFAGSLLEPIGASPSPESMNLAFSIAERMRARVLLDTLDAARVVAPHASKGPRFAERDALLERMAQVQKLLAQGSLDPEGKASSLREIDALEAKERGLRDEIARRDPRFAALKKPRVPSISEVQSLLAPDQALLAFELSTRRIDDTLWWSNGGSWVFVITRNSARVLPLPDADLLDKAIDIYVGMFARRDGLAKRAAVRLYDDLLKDALAGLPPAIRRLVVVPDRELHRLPFDALAAAPDDETLAARFEISIAPSATIWARWRRSEAPGPPETALALADPSMPSAAAPASLRQAAPWVEGLQLGPLPYARTEARHLARLLGPQCRLLEGAAASEHRLKTASPEDFGVLVLATHAVLDEEHPERSAVLLSPGAAEEDGLLQPREIVELPLEGRLVVLSSCSSASGTLLQGEGVVGLARAFFEAGARTVVASLWPMRDDEAAAVAGAFYRHLSEGQAVGAAMAAARRDRMLGGAPAAEWAGLVVLGDGDLVPFRGGAHARPVPVALFVVLFLAAALAALGIFRFWRSRAARA
jgi:CHAT domain-containing protein